MTELLNHFSVQDILLFIILLGLAIKGIFSFFQWLEEKGLKIFKNKYQKPANLEHKVERLGENLNTLTDNVNLLLQSDKDDIKAYIVREHHYFCYRQHQIDDQSLDCVEKRYAHYKREGGNSYIDQLVQELRSLPKATLTDPDK